MTCFFKSGFLSFRALYFEYKALKLRKPLFGLRVGGNRENGELRAWASELPADVYIMKMISCLMLFQHKTRSCSLSYIAITRYILQERRNNNKKIIISKS